jgi:hypothetical protein
MRYEMDMREGSRSLREARRNPSVVAAGIVTTVLVHAGLVGSVVYRAMAGDAQDQKPEQKMEFEDVELLQLGEDKPENQLPRISNPPAPTPEQETVTLDQKETEMEPEEENEPEKTQEKTNKAFEDLHDPNRPTNQEVPEGSEKGVSGGTVSDEAMANMMKTYQARLFQKISEYWEVPKAIPDAELQELFGEANVYVRLSKDGNIVFSDFRRRTSNRQFNRSIERLLEKFRVSGGGHTLPLPDDEEVRNKVLEQGLQLRQWHFTQ